MRMLGKEIAQLLARTFHVWKNICATLIVREPRNCINSRVVCFGRHSQDVNRTLVRAAPGKPDFRWILQRRGFKWTQETSLLGFPSLFRRFILGPHSPPQAATSRFVPIAIIANRKPRDARNTPQPARLTKRRFLSISTAFSAKAILNVLSNSNFMSRELSFTDPTRFSKRGLLNNLSLRNAMNALKLAIPAKTTPKAKTPKQILLGMPKHLVLR